MSIAKLVAEQAGIPYLDLNIIGRRQFAAVGLYLDDRLHSEPVRGGAVQAMSNELVRMRESTLGYGGRPVLDRLDFAIERGDFLGVMGRTVRARPRC